MAAICPGGGGGGNELKKIAEVKQMPYFELTQGAT